MKLVIFDMDGVLVDGCEWHRLALNEALLETRGFEISLEDHYLEFNGLPTKVKLLKLSEKGLIDISEVDEIERIKQEKTVNTIEKNATVRQEKIDLMKFLKLNNVKIACFTNSIRPNAELMLQKTGVLEHLDLLVTNQEVKNAKPDPEGYILCMNLMNVSKEDCLIIEDSPKGVQAAIASGANVLIVKDPDEVNIDLLQGKIK